MANDTECEWNFHRGYRNKNAPALEGRWAKESHRRLPIELIAAIPPTIRYPAPAMKTLHTAWEGRDKIVIGMLHLPALPGAARSNKSLTEIRDYTLRDAEALIEGGVDGLILENFGDAPFFPGRVPSPVISCMTALACDIRRLTKLPLGIN